MPFTYNCTRKGVMCLLLWWISGAVYGQTAPGITGKVVNQFTQEPLPFATVYWKAAGFGCMTDNAGIFKLKPSSRPADTLVARYVGYAVKYLPMQHPYNNTELILQLEATMNKGVEVKAKLDRGLVWWRQIVAHKVENSPRHYNNYYAELYNKLELDLANFNRKRLANNKLLQPFAFVLDRVDSTSEQKPFLPVFLSESVSDYYVAGTPPRIREEIKALHTSGIKNESVMEYLGGINQKINTYNNYMLIFKREFISPVSENGDRYYRYKGLDTIQLNGQSYFHLAFTPKREGENLFSGDCWVNSHSWALLKISLSVSGAVDINFVKRLDIIQEFAQLNEKDWVVTKDKFIVELAPLGNEKTTFIGRKTTQYQQIRVNAPDIAGKVMANKKAEEVLIADTALTAGKEYLRQHRPDPLSKNELHAITLVDTLKSMPAFTRLSNTFTFLVDGHIKLGKVEIGPWYKWISRNRIEGMRLRFDLGTTPEFNRNLRLFGYLAYGSKDKAMKGKMAVTYELPKTGWSFASWYKDDLDNNQRGFNGEEVSLDNIFGALVRRHGIPQKFIRQREFKLLAMKKIAGTFSIQGAVSHSAYTTFDPLPSHKMFLRQGEERNNLVNMEMQLNLRYAPGEKEIHTFRKIRRIRGQQPVLELNYALAPSGILDSRYNYQKVNVSLMQQVQLPNWGQLSYMVYGGKIFGDRLPFMLLQMHPGNETYYYNKQSFSLMNKYEFFSDQYAGINIEHHFDRKLLNLLPFMRRTGVRQFWNVKTVVGSMSPSNRSFNHIEFSDYGMRSLKGNVYTEVGTGIDNIFKFFRVDAVWRLYPNSKNASHAGNFGLFGSLRLQF
ncbi:carboxypeptidase-like regulatory domain-containing protein [Chitinophaga polysaccharea]|uniref:DUF5686 and carboxypeptidase-like regulatory domain-containing protein n=1 Tax=Chitinophaga polysaccharea TaxID=1293035 RepID=UPI0014552C68|nr:DUF5686 and carboxypeptidase-like regulatory domain-containing protein [Chitinophaga polysaccharea]NLR58668.1 carboxypeptidase-like regulatory domain-containing protein [Chitinophaga polysaccharea]